MTQDLQCLGPNAEVVKGGRLCTLSPDEVCNQKKALGLPNAYRSIQLIQSSAESEIQQLGNLDQNINESRMISSRDLAGPPKSDALHVKPRDSLCLAFCLQVPRWLNGRLTMGCTCRTRSRWGSTPQACSSRSDSGSAFSHNEVVAQFDNSIWFYS